MKATKKIVGAACALVAAVALSAGSTFAWFATNDKVTVTGMKVQATVPTNLYIAKNYITDVDGVNDESIDWADAKATELNPAAISSTATAPDATLPAALTDGKFYVLDAKTWEEGKKPTSGNSGTAATYTTIDTLTASIEDDSLGVSNSSTDAAWKKYVYKQDMTLANKSTKTNVTATVTVNFDNGSTDSYKFLRVGFVIGDGTSFKLISMENDLEATGVDYAAGDATTADELKFTYTNLIEDFESNTVQTVSFLVWFDGEDAECYVNNALTVSEFDVSILFQAVAATGTGTGD